MYAVDSGDLGVVQMLLDRGADPTPEDAHKKTALMYALEDKNQDIADALRHAGAVR
jgi:ankyrin repeat protein